MAREYFLAYHSYLETLTELSDAECGRLFRAALEYSATKKTPDLRGNERFLFATLKVQIDRDSQKYEEKCAANRENISKRWQNTENKPIDTNVYDRKSSYTQNTKDKEKAKTKENTKKNNITPLSTNVDISPLFEKFWSDYPKKVAKQSAFKVFRKIPKIEETLNLILAGVEKWKNSNGWQDSQFIPYPATFLSQRRWEDEIMSGGMQNADNKRDNGEFKPIRKCINEYPE